MFDWDDLRYFLLAVRAGTLAGAARAAGVQHTTVSRRLTSLERSLGTTLFVRAPDGLTLTRSGEQLVPLAQKAEQQMLAVADGVTSGRSHVRLTVPSGLIGTLGDVLCRVTQEHPEISLEVTSSSEPLDLERGDADLALRIGAIKDQELVARALGDVELSLYASQRYLQAAQQIRAPSDLSNQRVIALGSALSGTPVSDWLQAHRGNGTVVMRCNDMATVHEAAAAGAGIALLPSMVADADPRLVRLSPQVLLRCGWSLVYRKDQRDNPALRAVAKYIVGAVTERQGRAGRSP